MACLCPDWLCEAWEELARRSTIPIQEIAELMGISENELRCYGYRRNNPSERHRCAPQWRIVQAARASRNPVVINAMAQHADLTTPRPRKASGRSADSIVSHAIEQIGEVLKEVGKAITERPLRIEDKRKIRDRFRSLRIVFDDFEATVGQPQTRRMTGGSTA